MLDSNIAKEVSLYFNSQLLHTELISICFNENLMELFRYPLKIPTAEEYLAYKKWRLDNLITFFLYSAKLSSVQKECINSICTEETCLVIENNVAMLSEIQVSFDDTNETIVFEGKKGPILIIENMMNKFLNEVSFTYQQFILNKEAIKKGIAFLQPFASNELSCFIQMWVYQNIREE